MLTAALRETWEAQKGVLTSSRRTEWALVSSWRRRTRWPIILRSSSSESPESSEQGYLTAKERFSVESLEVIDWGEVRQLECKFANHSRPIDILSAYIAMNLRGSLKTTVDLIGLMKSKR